MDDLQQHATGRGLWARTSDEIWFSCLPHTICGWTSNGVLVGKREEQPRVRGICSRRLRRNDEVNSTVTQPHYAGARHGETRFRTGTRVRAMIDGGACRTSTPAREVGLATAIS